MTLETIKTKTDKNTAWVSSLTAEKTVKTIKDVAENIKLCSVMMRDTTKTIRESGAIPELAETIREVASAVRDTAKDIRQTARELKESGTIDDTARAVEETKSAAHDTIHAVRDTAEHIRHQIK